MCLNEVKTKKDVNLNFLDLKLKEDEEKKNYNGGWG